MNNLTIAFLAALLAVHNYWPSDDSKPLIAGLWIAVCVIHIGTAIRVGKG